MAAPDRNSPASPLRRGGQAAFPNGYTACFFAMLALGAPLGCKREAPTAPAAAPVAPPPAARAPAPAPAPADPGPRPADAKAATEWLDALRERDPGALRARMLLPFDFRDAHARKGKCGSRVATTDAAAKAVATCLATDARFHAELSATPEPRLVALDGGALPPWAQPWAKTLGPGPRALSTFVHGEADARELVLLVGDDGVHGVWQNLIIEPR